MPEIADRHWLAERGVIDGHVWEYLGGASQDHWEFASGYLLLQKMLRVRRILEVGVYSGYTMKLWLTLAEPDATAVAVDIAPQVTAEWPASVTLVIGDSHAPDIIWRVHGLCADGVDFLHIDGDHSLEGCLADYNAFAPLVRPNGVIAFHDIYMGDVRATWREVVKRYPSVQIQNTAPDGSRMGMGLAFNLPHVGGFKPIRIDE